MRRSLKIVLIVSLLLNLLMVAALSSMAIRFWWQGGLSLGGSHVSAMPKHVIEHLIEDLPQAQQNDFAQRFKQLQSTNNQMRTEIGQHRQQLRTLIKSSNFDKNQYQRLSQAILVAKQRAEAEFTLLLGDALAYMSIDDRSQLTRWLERGGLPKRSRKKRNHDDDDDRNE